MTKLKLHSGNCCQCDIGIPAGHNDYYNRPLHTGDIVLIYSGNFVGTDLESWSNRGITAVTANQYQSYSDGTVELGVLDTEPFIMGIKGCGFNDSKWRIEIIKKYYDVVDGEHWTEYGFNYRENAAAEECKHD